MLDGAVLEERLRIARELYDGLAQVLTFINPKALAVERLLETGRGDEAYLEAHKRLHTHRTFDSEQVDLNESAPTSGAFPRSPLTDSNR